MAKMTFGLRLPTYVWENEAASLDVLCSFGERAEQLGFECLWVVDHLLIARPSYLSSFHDPLVVLSALASRTTRIRLGTAILVLPLRPAAIVAKEFATLDSLSNGRLEFGVGVGWHEAEFTSVGVPISERGRRTDEYLEVLRRLWTGDSVSFQGKFLSFEDIQILPRPAQRPHPPIWIAGGSVLPPVFSADRGYAYRQFRGGEPSYEAVYRRIARSDGWMATAMATPELMRQDWAEVCRYAAEYGRDPKKIRRAQTSMMMVTDDVEGAKAIFGRFTGKALDEWAMKATYLIGSADQIAERIAERAEIGIDHMILTPVTFDVDQLDVWASKVLSRFR